MTRAEKKTVICGSLCTSRDILVGNSDQRGDKEDYVIFHLTGAYSVTESCTEFLSRSRPALFLLNEERGENTYSYSLMREKAEAQF